MSKDESADDRLTFRILDTGNGVSGNEIDNMHFRSLMRRKPTSTAKPTPSPSGCATG